MVFGQEVYRVVRVIQVHLQEQRVGHLLVETLEQRHTPIMLCLIPKGCLAPDL